MKKRICLSVCLLAFLLCSCTAEAGKNRKPISEYTADPTGYTYRIFTDQQSDVSLCSVDYGTVRSDQLKAHYAAVEKEFSCRIETNATFRKTILQELAAGAAASVNQVDLVETSAETVYALWQGGYLTALDELPGVDVSSEKWGLPSQKSAMTFDGKTYGFCGLWLGASFPTVSNVMFFNEKLIQGSGCVHPYELLEKEEWNWRSFETVANTVTEEIGDDGSVYAFVSPNAEYPQFITAAVYSNGSKLLTEDYQGKNVCGWNNDQTLDALMWVKKLIKEDKVSYDLKMEYDDGRLDTLAFINGRTAFLVGNAYAGVATSQDSPLYTLGEDLRWISFPRGPALPVDRTTAAYGTSDRFCAITASVGQNIANGVPILNAIFEPMEGEDENSYREVLKREYFFYDEDFEVYSAMMEKAESEGVFPASSLMNDIQNVLSGVVSGVKSGKQALIEIESVVNGTVK